MANLTKARACRSGCQYSKDVGAWPEHSCAAVCLYAEGETDARRELLHLADMGNPAQRDCRPDQTGLDDGPYLPGRAPRKRPEPKPPHVMAEIRRRAWETRRAALSQPGDGR